MAKKLAQDGLVRLKQELKAKKLEKLYIFVGEESYLRQHYLNACKACILGDGAFTEFNFFEYEGKDMTPAQLQDAVESYPVMAERKLVIVHDFDLYKMPAGYSEFLPDLLADLPDTVCLIFDYDILEYKPDKRTKIHRLLETHGTLVSFAHLDDRQLTDWVRRRFHACERSISDETIAHFLFLCGNSMTALIPEIEKAAAFCTIGEVKPYHVDAVCTPVLEAVIFDLGDAIAQRKFEKAIALVENLLAQKNTEVMIFSTICKHIQRLYAAKLHEQARRDEKELFGLLGSNSAYYARKLKQAARDLPEVWLRRVILLCSRTDAALKSSSADKKKLIELALLEMATEWEQV